MRRLLPGLLLLASGTAIAQPMVPLAPRAPAPPAAVVPTPPAITRTVIARRYLLGWHRLSGIEVLDGPWRVAGAHEAPGDETVEALGRTLTRCRTTATERGSVTWCPEAGIVAQSGPEGAGRAERSIVAIRRGEETWARSPCDVMHLVPDEERAPLCDRPLRTLGAGPRAGAQRCEWQYTLDGPWREGGPRAAVVTVRLDRDAAAIERWAGATPGQTVVEARTARTVVARSEGWTAAVRVRTDRCGARDGSAFAARLARLAPR